MARHRPRGDLVAVTIRLPVAVHADYLAVAAAKGMDLTALVNDTLANARPTLLRWLRNHEVALSAAKETEDGQTRRGEA